MWNERTSTRLRSARPPANRHTAAAVARASCGSQWALTSTCTGRSPAASPSSSSRSIGVSSVEAPQRSRNRARSRSLHTVWCAQPDNVVELLSHGSCSRTSRPSAVRHASVSRPSTGPASVARRAARDESGPGSRPRRCAYNWGSVVTTSRMTGRSPSHVAPLLPTRCRVVNTTLSPHRANARAPLAPTIDRTTPQRKERTRQAQLTIVTLLIRQGQE